MLHDGRNDDAVRAFFVEVHEVYIKVGLASSLVILESLFVFLNWFVWLYADSILLTLGCCFQVMLNPFYVPNSKVESREFDSRVKASAKRHLGFRGDI
jgi:hypothetical protein